MFKILRQEIEVEGKKIILETGKNSTTSRWCNYCNMWRNSSNSYCSWSKKS